MHENSRHSTAFITILVMFQPNFIPLGLKGVLAYFQKVIFTLVHPSLCT